MRVNKAFGYAQGKGYIIYIDDNIIYVWIHIHIHSYTTDELLIGT